MRMWIKASKFVSDKSQTWKAIIPIIISVSYTHLIVLHERSRVQKIENESIAIFQTQHNINTTHRYVTTLVTYGESVMVWNDEDSG